MYYLTLEGINSTERANNFGRCQKLVNWLLLVEHAIRCSSRWDESNKLKLHREMSTSGPLAKFAEKSLRSWSSIEVRDANLTWEPFDHCPKDFHLSWFHQGINLTSTE